MSKKEGIVAIDLGTTNVKMALYTIDGLSIIEKSASYPLYNPKSLWFEHVPTDWFDLIISMLKETFKEASRRGIKIIGLVSTGQREGLVPISRSGKPLHNCITWMDRRSSQEVKELISRFGLKELYLRTGLVAEPTYTIFKVMWFKRHFPRVYEKSWKLLQPKEYLNYLLTGNPTTDPSLASRTMAYNISKLDWYYELLEEVSIPVDKLPEIRASDDVIGYLREELKSKILLDYDVPVINGGGDRPCEALGAEVLSDARLGESTGTATNVITTVNRPVFDYNMRIMVSCHVLRSRWLMESGTSPTGAIIKWAIENFLEGLFHKVNYGGVYEGVDKEILKRLKDDIWLISLPHFVGSRAPYWREKARGAIVGLTLSHDKYHIIKSLMEGIAFLIRDIVKVYKDLGFSVKEFISYGGLAQSYSWNLIKASVLNMNVKVLRNKYPAVSGAVALAGLGLGIFPSLGDVPRSFFRIKYVCHPDEMLVEKYNKLYALYSTLNVKITEIIEEFGDL